MSDKKSIEAIEMALKAPFRPGSIKSRPADYRYERSTALLYLDARDVMDRLDETLGINNWMTEYVDIESRCVCKLHVRYDQEYDWIIKSDVGTTSQIESEKGMYSDALKRAAVQHGIGRYLYDDGILKGFKFELSNKKFTAGANASITEMVAEHYAFNTNQKAVLLSTLFSSAMTLKTLMEYYEENKKVIAELKEEDSVAARVVGDSFKKWASALKGMEKNG